MIHVLHKSKFKYFNLKEAFAFQTKVYLVCYSSRESLIIPFEMSLCFNIQSKYWIFTFLHEEGFACIQFQAEESSFANSAGTFWSTENDTAGANAAEEVKCCRWESKEVEVSCALAMQFSPLNSLMRELEFSR